MSNNGFKVGLHFYMKKENMAYNLNYMLTYIMLFKSYEIELFSFDFE